ncbi:MAG TPA: ATP-binding cassette domain-containing protein [Mycobacteriales bacterium]|nr:ATP-binding cassette domain-containing protein [Mycobacteriales bacterium]
MIEAKGLTKRYGDTLAVDDLTFSVEPGKVTGFLGPNGAGKSTTMRLILGLDSPTKGTVTVNGTPYIAHRRPLYEVGALLEAKAIHGGRTAYNHLLAIAQSNHVNRKRIDEVLDLVGLTTVASKRAKGFSLGMGQRLGIATALLADPSILILDEPVNGLDPEGILWVRNLLKHMATQGKTVFVSSHLMSEMALTADHLIVIGRGKLIADAGVNDVIQMSTTTHVRVRSPQADALAELITKREGTVVRPADGSLSVTGMTAEAVGELAASKRVVLHELVLVQASLEEAFMELTEDSVDFRAPGADAVPNGAFPNHGGAA